MSAASTRRVPRWPVLVIALGAFVSIWGGWVGLGELAGFGPVRLLPGIVDSFVLDSAITLPLGVEAYAAYALWVWLAPPDAGVSDRGRRFACWSSIAALGLGVFGQATYHLLAAQDATTAPDAVIVFVSCLPVLVLGAGAALTHLIHDHGGEQPQVVTAVQLDVVPADLDPAGEDEPEPVAVPAPAAPITEPLVVEDEPARLAVVVPWWRETQQQDDEPGAATSDDDLLERVRAVIVQEITQGRRMPKRRRVSTLLGLGEDSYDVRRVFELHQAELDELADRTARRIAQ